MAPITYLSITEVAEVLGLGPATIRTYRSAGRLPEPDAIIGSTPGWCRDTIEAWHAARLPAAEPGVDLTGMLSMREIAERLGIEANTLRSYRSDGRLPEPDAMLGMAPRWRPETIDTWHANRPGRGVGGGRPRKNASLEVPVVMGLSETARGSLE